MAGESGENGETGVAVDRFVVIDGVQYSRARAIRLGLVEAPKETESVGHESRTRSPRSVRRGATPDAVKATGE